MRRSTAPPSASMRKDRRRTCARRVTPHLPRCCMTSFCAPHRQKLAQQPRSSAPPASQTDYIAIAPGIGVFDPLRHYGRFTRPPGEVAGPPNRGSRLLGASGSNAGSGASSADHPADAPTTLAAFAPLHAASTTANCPRRNAIKARFWSHAPRCAAFCGCAKAMHRAMQHGFRNGMAPGL
jgi:hypothetical protein